MYFLKWFVFYARKIADKVLFGPLWMTGWFWWSFFCVGVDTNRQNTYTINISKLKTIINAFDNTNNVVTSNENCFLKRNYQHIKKYFSLENVEIIKRVTCSPSLFDTITEGSRRWNVTQKVSQSLFFSIFFCGCYFFGNFRTGINVMYKTNNIVFLVYHRNFYRFRWYYYIRDLTD